MPSTPAPSPFDDGSERAAPPNFDDDRTEVAALLSHAYAEGRITHDEHDERLDLAMRATTFDELLPLTEDLVPLDRPIVSVAERAAPASGPASGTGPDDRPSTQQGTLPPIEPTAAVTQPDRITAILRQVRRRNTDRLRRKTELIVVLGEVELDMRNAVFDDIELEVSGAVLLGEIKIWVPTGVDVRDQTINLLAENKIEGLDPKTGGPVITLRGTFMLAEILVRGPLAQMPPQGRALQ